MPPFWQLTAPVTDEVSEGLANLAWELGALGVVEDAVLTAFFPPDVGPEDLAARVRDYLDALRALGYAIDETPPSVRPATDDAWAEAWQEHFRPIPVGRRLLVAPPWDVPETPRVVVVIEPGRAFGTGHHGTTAGCLALLERVIEQRDSVDRALDVGTGSGILAVVAARFGVRHVLAIDIDPDAVAAARANAARNDVADRVEVRLLDGAALAGAYDAVPLVLANLLAAAHQRLAHHWARALAPGGVLVVGGILANEAAEVARALARAGLEEVDRELIDGWTSLALVRV